jgi:hypothetical protein
LEGEEVVEQDPEMMVVMVEIVSPEHQVHQEVVLLQQAVQLLEELEQCTPVKMVETVVL